MDNQNQSKTKTFKLNREQMLELENIQLKGEMLKQAQFNIISRIAKENNAEVDKFAGLNLQTNEINFYE